MIFVSGSLSMRRAASQRASSRSCTKLSCASARWRWSERTLVPAARAVAEMCGEPSCSSEATACRAEPAKSSPEATPVTPRRPRRVSLGAAAPAAAARARRGKARARSGLLEAHALARQRRQRRGMARRRALQVDLRRSAVRARSQADQADPEHQHELVALTPAFAHGRREAVVEPDLLGMPCARGGFARRPRRPRRRSALRVRERPARRPPPCE